MEKISDLFTQKTALRYNIPIRIDSASIVCGKYCNWMIVFSHYKEIAWESASSGQQLGPAACRIVGESSAESNLVTVRQPGRHLHGDI